MTIREAAEKYQVSKQAIYQRLKANKINLDTLKDKETGELTAEAEAIIDNLFGENSKDFKSRQAALSAELTRANETISRQQTEIEILKIKLEAAERELSAYKETLEKERALFTRFLPAPEEQQAGKRQGLFNRLFGRK